jgi:hypothetical protein
MGYVRAKSLAELWFALGAHGGSNQIIAGGQTLLATLAFRLSEPATLIDITGIEELRGISAQNQVLRLGALTLHADLCRDALVKTHAPLLAAAAPLIAWLHASTGSLAASIIVLGVFALVTLGCGLAFPDRPEELAPERWAEAAPQRQPQAAE